MKIDESFEGRQDEALALRESALNNLNTLLDRTMVQEKEKAELEELRKKQEEQEAKDREESTAGGARTSGPSASTVQTVPENVLQPARYT